MQIFSIVQHTRNELKIQDCIEFVYFKSSVSRTWPDLELKFGCSQIRIWGEHIFGSQNNTPNKTNDVNNAVSCYKEAIQFSASFVTSLFASFLQNLLIGN